MSNINELIGKKVWFLTFIKEVEPIIDTYGKKARKFLCKCDCKKEIIVYGKAVLTGNTKSCGCYKKKVAFNNLENSMNVTLKWEEILYNRHISHCKGRKIENFLNLQEFTNYLKKDCYYCKDSPSNICKYKQNTFNFYSEYQGIDRVDSNKGYSVDNCVPCCRHCNWGKYNQDIEIFENRIVKMYKELIKRDVRHKL